MLIEELAGIAEQKYQSHRACATEVMSVKFEKDTVRDMPVPGGRKHEIAHEIGEKLTGGETAQGYLAVSGPDTLSGRMQLY